MTRLFGDMLRDLAAPDHIGAIPDELAVRKPGLDPARQDMRAPGDAVIAAEMLDPACHQGAPERLRGLPGRGAKMTEPDKAVQLLGKRLGRAWRAPGRAAAGAQGRAGKAPHTSEELIGERDAAGPRIE